MTWGVAGVLLTLIAGERVDLRAQAVPSARRGTRTPLLALQTVPSPPARGSVVWLVVPPAGTPDSSRTLDGTAAGEPLHFERLPSGRFRTLLGIPLEGGDSLAGRAPRSRTAPSPTRIVATLSVTQPVYASERLTVAPRYAEPDSASRARIDGELAQSRAISRQAHDTPRLWQGPFLRPRPSRITSVYGTGREFNGRVTSRHLGTDFAGAVGAPVRAAGRAVVALVADFYLAGHAVYLDHGGGLVTGYFHLSRVDVDGGRHGRGGRGDRGGGPERPRDGAALALDSAVWRDHGGSDVAVRAAAGGAGGFGSVRRVETVGGPVTLSGAKGACPDVCPLRSAQGDEPTDLSGCGGALRPYPSFSCSTGCTPFGSAFPLLRFITWPNEEPHQLGLPAPVARHLGRMRGQHLVHPACQRALVAHLHEAEPLGHGLGLVARLPARARCRPAWRPGGSPRRRARASQARPGGAASTGKAPVSLSVVMTSPMTQLAAIFGSTPAPTTDSKYSRQRDLAGEDARVIGRQSVRHLEPGTARLGQLGQRRRAARRSTRARAPAAAGRDRGSSGSRGSPPSTGAAAPVPCRR